MIQLLRLLFVSNDFLKAIEVLKNEIEFLKENEKCKKDGIHLYIMDYFFVLMIIHDTAEIDKLIEEFEFYKQERGVLY